MGRTKAYGEKLRTATREKILCAAVTLFAEKGLAGTSAKDIAKEADISIGLMYHYYKTKDEVYEAVVDTAFLEITEMRNTLNEHKSVDGIEIFASKIVKEMQKGLKISQWISILFQSPDFNRELICELANIIPHQKAQFFVGTIRGICGLHLMLKSEYSIPPVQLITSFLFEDFIKRKAVIRMATYKQIQDYVKEKHGYIPRATWIAHAKEIYGLNPQMAVTRRSPDKRVNPCPTDKQDDLRKAFEHFNMI